MESRVRWSLALTLFLCTAGIVLSVLSLYVHTKVAFGMDAGKMFCDISETLNCEAAVRSPWSTLFGIPLASWGLWFYVSVFIFSLCLFDGRILSRSIWKGMMLVLFLLASLFSVGLFAYSKFALGSLCPMCLGLYLVNFLLLGAAFLLPGDAAPNAVRKGVAAFGHFGRSLLGGKAATVAWALFLLLAILLFSAYAAGDYLLVHYVIADAQREEAKAVVGEAVTRWKDAPAQNIPIEESGPAADFQKGEKTAPVVIVEYSDFECPACRVFYGTMEEILKTEGSNVRLVYKNFPLDPSCNPAIKESFHDSACYAAHFARCAGEQNKFWEAADFLFNLGLSELEPVAAKAAIDGAAEKLGLNPELTRTCVNDERHKGKLLRDMKEAEQLGLEGTPAVWVNGKRLAFVTDESVRAVIKEVLKTK